MTQTIPDVFDNVDGKFVARLREISSNTRTTADGKATITFKTARIDAGYSPEIIRKIEAGRLLAIPNVIGIGSNDNYSIYEIADIYPMHYSMLTLDNKQPGAIRKEYMTLIEKGWHSGSRSTWIEIVAAPTGYTMQLDGNGPAFIRKNITPLTGSEVSLLSDETIQRFICYSPKDETSIENYTIGHLLGATDNKIPFTVNIEKLLHYHVGVFAFTGSGKSNLTSFAIRKAMNSIPDVKFVIFDISSEYGINILDLLQDLPSRVLFSEDLSGKNSRDKAAEYLRRHVIPERLVATER